MTIENGGVYIDVEVVSPGRAAVLAFDAQDGSWAAEDARHFAEEELLKIQRTYGVLEDIIKQSDPGFIEAANQWVDQEAHGVMEEDDLPYNEARAALFEKLANELAHDGESETYVEYLKASAARCCLPEDYSQAA